MTVWRKVPGSPCAAQGRTPSAGVARLLLLLMRRGGKLPYLCRDGCLSKDGEHPPAAAAVAGDSGQWIDGDRAVRRLLRAGTLSTLDRC